MLVTDRLMPGLDGLELCRRVRADLRPGDTYVVLVAALGSARTSCGGMEAGADDYLVKPVDPFDLRPRLIAAQRVTDLHAELASSRAELAQLARTDPLTGLGNRRSLDEELHQADAALYRAKSAGRNRVGLPEGCPPRS